MPRRSRLQGDTEMGAGDGRGTEDAFRLILSMSPKGHSRPRWSRPRLVHVRFNSDSDRQPSKRDPALRAKNRHYVLGASGDLTASSRFVRPSLISADQLARRHIRLCHTKNRLALAHSINSSALIRMDVGRVRPSDFATRALTISSMEVGSSIGMSPGLVPFSILSIK